MPESLRDSEQGSAALEVRSIGPNAKLCEDNTVLMKAIESIVLVHHG